MPVVFHPLNLAAGLDTIDEFAALSLLKTAFNMS